MSGSPLPDSYFDYVEQAELEPHQRWSTWDEIGILAGPEPWPDWLITADAAIDTELGILKTGKEADVFLLERATETESVVLEIAVPWPRAPRTAARSRPVSGRWRSSVTCPGSGRRACRCPIRSSSTRP